MPVEYVSKGAMVSTSGAAVDVPIASGSNGELLVLQVINNTTGTTPTPSGWTLGPAISVPAANGTATQLTYRHYYRERDGTEGANVNIDPSATANAWTLAVSGANMDNPFGAYQTESSILTDQVPLASPGFIKAGQLAVCVSDGATGATTAASGGTNLTWTEIQDPVSESFSYAINIAEASADTFIPQQELACTNGGTACQCVSILISPEDIYDQFITGTGTGSQSVFANALSVDLLCTGAGGGGSVTTGAEGGGGGGAHSATLGIDVTGGGTVYRSIPAGGAVATAGGDAWLRYNTNSAPTSTADGCLAKGGGGGSGAGATGGTGGSSASGVGDVKFSGGDGATGQGGGGSRAGSGGGASAGYNNVGPNGTAGSGSTQGPGGLASASGGARGGYGGNSAASGITGFTPGGGGGGGGNSGGNANGGGQGRVRMVWTLTPPATVGRATETNTASARGMGVAASRSNETDTASACSPLVVLATQRPIETDSAFNRGLAQGIGRATETDTAFALSQGIVQLPVGRADETDTAFKAGGVGMAPNRAIETDSAFNRGTVLQVQRANETDTAFERPRLGGVGVAIEADTAFALGKVFILPCNGKVMVRNGTFETAVFPDWNTNQVSLSLVNGRMRVTATTTGNNNQHANADFPHTSPILTSGRWYRIAGEGVAGNRDAVIRLNGGGAGAPGQPFVNSAFSVEYQVTGTSINFACHVGNSISVNSGDFADFDNLAIYPMTVEQDSAFALNRLDTPSWTSSEETDTAFALVPGFPVVRANESDLAFARTGVFIRGVGRADEAEIALALNRIEFRPVGMATEVEVCLNPGLGWTAGRANSTNTAFACAALVAFNVGRADELDTAFQMFGALEAGSGRKPHTKGLESILRDRVQPVHKSL